QNTVRAVSTSPWPGTGSPRTTSKGEMRSLATSSRWSSSTSYRSRTFPEPRDTRPSGAASSLIAGPPVARTRGRRRPRTGGGRGRRPGRARRGPRPRPARPRAGRGRPPCPPQRGAPAHEPAGVEGGVQVVPGEGLGHARLAQEQVAEAPLALPGGHGRPLHGRVRVLAGPARGDQGQQGGRGAGQPTRGREVGPHPLGGHAQAGDQPVGPLQGVVEQAAG